MPRKPKIFISHSTKNDENLNFLLNLYAALQQNEPGAEGFEVLVDRKKLQAGDQWHYKINEWMHECNAAIILLTEDALQSDWVKAESTVVAVRRRIETDFELIPVLLDNITDEAVKNNNFLGSGSAARLNDFQFINETDENSIFSEIKNILSGLEANKTPFERIGEVIAQILKAVDEQTLKSVWQQLGGSNKPNWTPGSGPFADALMRYLLRQEENCLKRFEDIVDKIHPKLDGERARELLEYIRALWVHEGAAKCLPATTLQANRMAAINGKLLPNFTFQRYIEKAWPLTNKLEPISITKIDSTDVIQQQMREHFQESQFMDYPIEPEEYDEDINGGDPVIVYLPTSESEGGLLDFRMRRELTVLYPKVIFLMGTGESLPVDVPADVLCVEPALDIGVEKKQMHAERKATRFLNKYCGKN